MKFKVLLWDESVTLYNMFSMRGEQSVNIRGRVM
jgi:hypothetical protein